MILSRNKNLKGKLFFRQAKRRCKFALSKDVRIFHPDNHCLRWEVFIVLYHNIPSNGVSKNCCTRRVMHQMSVT